MTAQPRATNASWMSLVGRRAEYDRHIAKGETWGTLRFCVEDSNVLGLPAFIPEMPHDPDPDHWNPGYEVAALMYSPGGELIGTLAFDDPENGRIPDPVQRELMEKYTAQAAMAIVNARKLQDARSKSPDT
jgi:hypothetical protein